MISKKEVEARFSITEVTPIEVIKRMGEQPFTVKTLFSEIFRPHYKYFGENFATIDGVYLPDQTDKKKGNFTLIDFSRSQDAGLNLLTLFAISAALQGSRISVTKKCDDWGIAKEERPMSYDDSFQEELLSWIKQASQISEKTSFTEDNKVTFYLALSEMTSLVLKGENPGEAFNYFMDSRLNLSVGFSIFSNFFPHIAEKIDEKAIYTLLNNGYDFEDVLRGFITNNLEKFFDIDSGIELAFLLQFPPDTVATLIKLQKDHLSLNIDWSLSKEIIIEEINKIARGETIETVYVEKKEKTEGDFPNPEKFGMKVNEVETRLMKEYFNKPDAVVISPSEIRKNPAQFWEYQRALVLKIAENHRIKIDEGIEIPLPEEYDEKQERSFRSTERILKENSDWIWLLLYPDVQKEFLARLPYVRVPPYLLINGKAIPVSDQERHHYITSKILEDEKNIINRLSFLNFIDLNDVRKKRKVNTRHNLTIPGRLLKEIIKEKGFAYLDHGIARWVFGIWGENYELEPLSYAEYGAFAFDYIPKVDVDMLAFGVTRTLGNIGNDMVKKMNPNISGLLYSNLMMGLSMGKVDWTFVVKNIKRLNLHRIRNDPYMLAHSEACLVQALRGWQAGTPKQNTDLLVETLIGFSKIRTFGLLPELLTDSNGAEFFAVKPVDVFGGLMDYLEAGGGVEVEGKKKNVIRFTSLDRAFSSDSVWHALRTIADMVYTTGGAVILPEKNLEISSKKIDISAVCSGINQFKERLEPIYQYIETIRKGDIRLDNILKKDLRRELIKSAQGLIEYNLNHFLTLSSDHDTFDKENLLFGFKLSRLFPHLDILRKYNSGQVWKNIKETIEKQQRQPEESALHFLARTILGLQIEQSILPIISISIREEFRENPLRTGNKLSLFESDYDKKKSLIEHGLLTRANWALLDPLGLGLFASGTNTHKWLQIISFLESGTLDITDELRENPSVIRVLEKHGNWSYSFRDRKLHFPPGETLLSKITEDQINALADWLIDPGF